MPAVRRGTAVLFFLALFPRLALLFAGPWLDVERAKFDDSHRHLALAENLRKYFSFGLAEEEPTRAWTGVFDLRKANGTQPAPDSHGLFPEVLRTPGYAVFLLVTSIPVGGDFRVSLFVQCLLGAASAACVFRLGRGLGLSYRPAFVAGLIMAFHPGLVERDCQLLPVSLFVSLGVIGLTRAACGTGGWKNWLFTGACLGFAGLVRPLGFLYVLVADCYLWRHERRRIPAILAVTTLALLPAVAWMARNDSVGNGFRLTSAGDLTLLFHFGGSSIAEERHEDWLHAWPATSEELLKKLGERVKPGDDVFLEARNLGVEELKSRPAATGEVLAKSWAKLYLAHSAGEMYQLLGQEYKPANLVSRYALGENPDGTPPAIVDMVVPIPWTACNGLLSILAAVGTVVGLRRRYFAYVFPLLLTVLLFTVATMSQGSEQFRLPFLFALILLAVAPFGLRRVEASHLLPAHWRD